MTEHSPFSARNNRSGPVSEWGLIGFGPEAELGRLERYCAEMNRRDPHGRFWYVAGEDSRRYVDCRQNADPGPSRITPRAA